MGKGKFILRVVWSIASFALFANSHAAHAVMAERSVRKHAQSDGTVVRYQAHGDEFLNYMTDSNGNLVAFGDDGDLYLAQWVDLETFASQNLGDSNVGLGVGSAIELTGVKVSGERGEEGQSPPNTASSDFKLNTPIPGYILDHANRAIDERDRQLPKPSGEKPDDGAFVPFSEQAPPKQVSRNLLVIYVKFTDESNLYSDLKNIDLSNEEIYDFIFNVNKEGSVAHYYKTVTGGKVNFVPARETCESNDDGIIKVTISGQHKNWRNEYSADDNDEKDNLLIPALKEADEYIDFSDYLTPGSDLPLLDPQKGLSIMLIVHGYESSYASPLSKNYPSIWGHARGLEYEYYWDSEKGEHIFAGLPVHDGVYIQSFCAFGAYLGIQPPRHFPLGLAAHELGHHSFSFKDLYALDASEYLDGNRTYGISGHWSLMGSGSWGTFTPNVEYLAGAVPTALDAYHLSTVTQPAATVKYGDISNLQEFSLTNASQFMRLETNDEKQYFLLQPRGDVGYDRGLRDGWGNPNWNGAQGGLIIYHIDESRLELENGANPGWKTRPFFDIEEAHGSQQDLQNNTGSATPYDLFDDTKTFTPGTKPNSNLYDSETAENTPSGVAVTSISPVVTGANTDNGTVRVGFKVGNPESSVNVPVTGIVLDYESVDMNLGDTMTLIATLSPENASNKTVTWSASDSGIAAAADGLVTAVGVGTVTITAASSSNPSQTASCEIKVARIPIELVSADADGGSNSTSTKIDLKLDKPVTELDMSDINIVPGGIVTITGVSGSGINWRAAVSDVRATKTVSVSVNDFGPYEIIGSPKDVTVYKKGLPHTPTTDAEAVATGKAALTWSVIRGDNASRTSVTANLNLPASGAKDTSISWSSDNTAVVTDGGVVVRPSFFGGDKSVVLIATITKGDASDTVPFDITVVKLPLVAVRDISGVPSNAAAGTPLTLTGTVEPDDATNKTIVWSVENAGAAGASISGNTLSADASGTVVIRATIVNGADETTDYTESFTIDVTSPGDGASINLNSLNGSFTGSKWSYDHSTGTITATGSGSLAVTGTVASALNIATGTTGAAVNFNGTAPSVVMTGNGKLVVNAGASIIANTGNAITSEGDVEINGGTISSFTGSAIVTTNANVAVKGGTVTAPGTDPHPTIDAGGGVTVSGGGMVESTDDSAGGVAITSAVRVQIDGGGVFADIDAGTAISAPVNSVSNGVVSSYATGVNPSGITGGLVIDGMSNTGRVHGDTTLKVDAEIPAGMTVSFEPGGILNVDAGKTFTIEGELDTTGGAANVSGTLTGTGSVAGNGSLVEEIGGYIDSSLSIGQDINRAGEPATNPDSSIGEEAAGSTGCDSGTQGIAILTLLTVFSLVPTVKKRLFKRK
jgi:M6 family metalloprotease-like protein